MTTRAAAADEASDILARIKAHKVEEVAALARGGARARFDAVCRTLPPARPFADRIAAGYEAGEVALIAEIKKMSPSKGVIVRDFDVPRIARAYRNAGAACLSVLTDGRFFGGSWEDVSAAAAASGLPVLRKDFLIDPIQVLEARAMGADCVLLILAMIDDVRARELEDAALEIGLGVLIEVHDDAELDRALGMRSALVGINNRDLRTFTADLGASMRLRQRIGKDRYVVSESGITGPRDVKLLLERGICGFLIGESLLSSSDIEQATREICGTAGKVTE